MDSIKEDVRKGVEDMELAWEKTKFAYFWIATFYHRFYQKN
jgi:hypothetical protein